jgi:hypothetical protein
MVYVEAEILPLLLAQAFLRKQTQQFAISVAH